jgi:hypothetical protein
VDALQKMFFFANVNIVHDNWQASLLSGAGVWFSQFRIGIKRPNLIGKNIWFCTADALQM